MSIVYFLEQPKTNSVTKYGIISVGGWAFSPNSCIEKIEVRLDGKVYKANLGIKREDVAQCHSAFREKAYTSGFSLEIKINEKQLLKRNKLQISIFAKNEKLKLQDINLLPENVENLITIKDVIKEALFKIYRYFKAGKFPKNFNELKNCFQKLKLIFNTRNFNNRSKIKIDTEPYKLWMIKNNMNNRKLDIMQDEMKNFSINPLISIIMPAYKPDENFFCQAIESVINQTYGNWELCIVDDCTPGNNVKTIVERYSKNDKRILFFRMEKNSHISLATNRGAEESRGEFIFLMDHDDLITEDALFEVAKVINNNENTDIIYSDDDKISVDGVRYDPQFKPDFSPELLLSYMYFSHIFVIRKSLFNNVGGCRQGYEGSQDFDLALRTTEITDNIIHIPKVLYHWRATPTSTATSAATKPYSIINGKKAVEDAIERRGIPATVIIPKFADDACLGIFSLKYKNESNPKVSIIIPTKNHKDILERCINSIVEKSTYENYEIIIVDNYSDDRDTLSYLEILSYKVIKVENINGRFNFSRMVNIGVENSDGDYVILLNNDTEVISPTWIEDMIVYQSINNVGVVGCKLLYPDNLIQHAGVVLKMFNGLAGHAFKLLNEWDGGYLSYVNVARNYSAVTAACFMTSRAIFKEVNGFDEDNFSVSFNDVDFCLRVVKSGYRVVYNPEALLFHHEGKSRGLEQTGYYSDPKEEYNFVTKWIPNKRYTDPYYNPNLSEENEKFIVEYKNVYSNECRNLHVLLITHNLNYEGAPLMQLNICRQLIEYGYKFTILSPSEGPLKNEYNKLGISVIIKDIVLVRDFINIKMYKQTLIKIAEELEQLNLDLVYSNTIETFWGIKLAEILDLPNVWGIHESVDFKTYFDCLGKDIQEESIDKFRSATKVAFVAKATAKMYETLDTCNFSTIKNGIDINKVEDYKNSCNRNNLREKMMISKDTIVISIFGAVCMRKGQKIFLQAAKQVIEKSDKKVLFQIVGAKDSTYLQELLEYIDENNMNKSVKIIYTCEDIYQYYVVSDIFVCASYEESSPQVILESMAFQIPIVSTNVFGIPELVRNEREALLIDAGDSDSMANLLIRLMGNNELCEELKYNAYYRVRTNFSIEKMIQKYDDLFQSIFVEGKNNIYEYFIKGDKK